ncbi:alpha/beta hydrolase [Okeania sp.]|uniref:alpha/beta hydrolase n=1 Tax=Okeania sp. TaxID=3100323 RepID=UPI002B4AF732|nr:alpha/beta hydrolase [Okeania sp.]MEB3341888.1 alpha/beta hydrolase [Okeania sp.]
MNHNFPIKHHGKTKKRILLYLGFLLLGTIPFLLTNFSEKSAEKIYFHCGIFRIGIPLTALKNYAERGKIDKELKFYLLFINLENQQKLRNFLNFQLQVNPRQLTQGLYSQMGKKLLNYVGEMIQIDDTNGAVPIREALIITATSQDLTPINLLDNFSGQIQFDLIKIIRTTTQFVSLVQDTEKLLQEVNKLTLTAADTEPKINFSRLPDLRQPGNFYFYQKILKLNDKSRQRQFLVKFYLPYNLPKTQTIPLVILSPGLAVELNQWQHLAKHLVSYGFAVAKVQHPGSDFKYFQAFLDGEEKNIFQLEEFINRPLDISYLLDELEKRNKFQFQGKLNLKNVGITGQSFGAYTALSVAGAKINFEQLKQDCLPQIQLLNPSLLLQCRALELPQQIYQNYNFRDARIKSLLVIDPVNRSIFSQLGLSHINIPILWVGGSADQLTPVVIEQINSFTWLPVKEKYFMLTKGAKHLDFNITAIQNVESVNDDSLNQFVSESSPVIKSYINAFGLAFFQFYIRNDSNYFNYLRSSYALAISKEPYTLSFLSALTRAELVQIFGRKEEARKDKRYR